MYKFVKIKDNRTGIIYPNWFLLADSVDIIIIHTEHYMATQIENGVIDFFEVEKGTRYYRSDWASSVNGY